MRISHSEFSSPAGIGEHFFSGISVPARDFVAELDALWRDYEAAMAEYGCDEDSEMLLRFHLSDAANQGPLLRKLLGGRPALCFSPSVHLRQG